jgi:predicted acylesterase/phospholipase RssA
VDFRARLFRLQAHARLTALSRDDQERELNLLDRMYVGDPNPDRFAVELSQSSLKGRSDAFWNSRGKTALVLAGGGLTGAVYEIGALRAIDDLLTDRTVNDFDLYVGTSAGALVGSLLANGITPEVMLQALAGDHPDIRAIERGDLFYIDPRDLLQLGAKLPKTVSGAWSHYLRYLKDMTLFDFIWSLSELPSGIYDSQRGTP